MQSAKLEVPGTPRSDGTTPLGYLAAADGEERKGQVVGALPVATDGGTQAESCCRPLLSTSCSSSSISFFSLLFLTPSPGHGEGFPAVAHTSHSPHTRPAAHPVMITDQPPAQPHTALVPDASRPPSPASPFSFSGTTGLMLICSL